VIRKKKVKKISGDGPFLLDCALKHTLLSELLGYDPTIGKIREKH
jgi:hypothetical protein